MGSMDPRNREYPIGLPGRKNMAPTGKTEEYTDQSVRIPEQALKAGEEAERLHREWLAGMEAELKGPTGKTAEPEKKIEAAPTGGVDSEVKEKPSAYELLLKEKEAAEHRYDVLKGKYNAEVPDFALKLTQALNKISSLENEMVALRAQPGTPQDKLEGLKSVKEALAQDPSIQYLKDELPKVYDALDVFFEKTIAESSKSLKEEIKQLREEVKVTREDTARSDREKFYGVLSDKVKGWEVINESPEWKAWLLQTDRHSGLTRQAMISDAYNKMDSTRTVNFFTDYIEEAGLVKDKNKAREVVEEPIPKKKEDVAPNTVKIPVPGADIQDKNKPEFITSSEVNDYYRKLEKIGRLGQTTPEDVKIRGLQIDKAIQEGRVIKG